MLSFSLSQKMLPRHAPVPTVPTEDESAAHPRPLCSASCIISQAIVTLGVFASVMLGVLPRIRADAAAYERWEARSPAETVRMLNSRFAAGRPSNDLASAGVLVRQLDGLDDGRSNGTSRPWMPCRTRRCNHYADRWPATLISARAPYTFSSSAAGLVLDPRTTRIYCAYPGDGNSNLIACDPLGGGEQAHTLVNVDGELDDDFVLLSHEPGRCVPGCQSGKQCASGWKYCDYPVRSSAVEPSRTRRGAISREGVLVALTCVCTALLRRAGPLRYPSAQPERLKQMLAVQEEHRGQGARHNEVVVDLQSVVDHLPGSIVAVFYMPASADVGDDWHGARLAL